MLKRLTILAIFLLAALAAQSWADDGVKVLKQVEVKSCPYYLTEIVGVNAPYSPYRTYPAYPQYNDTITIYHIRTGAEFTNRSGQEIQDVKVTCYFTDNFGKVLGSNSQKLGLKPGEKARMIFYSGLKSTGTSGFSIDDMSRMQYLTPEDEKEFLNFAKDLKFGSIDSFNAVLDLQLTRVKTYLEMEYGGKTYRP